MLTLKTKLWANFDLKNTKILTNPRFLKNVDLYDSNFDFKTLKC